VPILADAHHTCNRLVNREQLCIALQLGHHSGASPAIL
jgi:hypothetical protein